MTTKVNIFVEFFRAVSEPPESIKSAKERKTASIISLYAFASFFLVTPIVFTFQIITLFQPNLALEHLWIGWFNLGCNFVSYFISRTKHYKLAAHIIVFSTISAIALGFLLTPDDLIKYAVLCFLPSIVMVVDLIFGKFHAMVWSIVIFLALLGITVFHNTDSRVLPIYMTSFVTTLVIYYLRAGQAKETMQDQTTVVESSQAS